MPNWLKLVVSIIQEILSFIQNIPAEKLEEGLSEVLKQVQSVTKK